MSRRSLAVRRALRQGLRFRRAGPRDLELLVAHRLGMWRDIGTRTERSLRDHAPLYLHWIRPRLASGDVEAVVAEVGGRPVASGAIWWMPAHPRPGLPVEVEPYLMSMFTEPRYRGAGIATDLVEQLVTFARRKGAYRVVLHASEEGRPVYERLGFERTTEMRKLLKPPVGIRAAKRAATPRARAGSRR